MLQYPLPVPQFSLRSKDKDSSAEVFRRSSTKRSNVKKDSGSLISGPAFAAFSHPHASPAISRPSKQSSSRPTKIDIPAPPSTYSPTLSYNGPSTTSSSIAATFFPGDLIGPGIPLLGEHLRIVHSTTDSSSPADQFEIIKLLGTGSYASVYLVREVIFRSDDDQLVGRLDLDDSSRRSSTEYGREYAIKCLSKANLDEEALQTQIFEATIHQSLPKHPNIVTLYRTLETSSLLLLLLEYVPGQDLFYFLEQARDHYETDPLSSSPNSDSSCTSSSRTPPTPSLLSSLNPDQLLSRTRLRLIASMFAQMCDAVATCHKLSVFHRDIKPENFIVTDGWHTLPDGRQERKVLVKLSDFGLSTNDVESSDMDCGSAPYMSYECRNNVAPTYSPRAADVWSLGIVLINMLYHYNPWTDTAQGVCSSFELFRKDPVAFFMGRFTGMTLTVARFLANRVFCILPSGNDDSLRITAEEFGLWARDLPSHFLTARPGHQRKGSTASTQGHPIACGIPQSRPASRQASLNPAGGVRRGSKSMSRTPSVFESAIQTPQLSDLPTVLDDDQENECQEDEDTAGSRSASTQKRRKRGARKGKGSIASGPDATSYTLAEASQALARELSRTSNTQSPATPSFDMANLPPLPVIQSNSQQAASSVSKKTSKWKLSFGKSSGGATSLTVEEAGSPDGQASGVSAAALSAASAIITPASTGGTRQVTSTVSSVTNLINGLSPPPPKSSSVASPQSTPRVPQEQGTTFTSRGRRGKSPSRSTANGPYGNNPYIERWANNIDHNKRGASPTSTRSGRQLASSASSMSSDNWRAPSSAATSTSAFTRFSNGSASTIATSVSSGSWRNPNPPTKSVASVGSSRSYHYGSAPIPPNIKIMDGVPKELGEFPRYYRSGDVESSNASTSAARKQRGARKGPSSDFKLDTISERPVTGRADAGMSTTDLNDVDGTGPKKVQKGQINALAKMLSALRR